ncbi:hypothetical protein CIW83_02800 [Tissierella sp. P1]|uniref:hypothetical protein n=1 Tax=Tissierella sp. P1 TaxID=1280483 RepID=UPI000BA03708|nr:hypothetical protein [Tissierella sp. P1]OZV13491.1 hypothetical protein CIW83_02800 [Tissierella sp. P1]
MGYVDALVFFIDILGSQDRNDFDELFQINETFHGELEKNQSYDKPHTAYERVIYTFSDCAYIIYNFKEGIEEGRKDLRKLFDIALRNTEYLIMQFLKKGFLCRGGIAYDKVYYEKERSLFFGPAVNRAHYFEDKISVVPRIIMDDYIATNVLALNQEWLDNASSQEEKQLIQESNGNIVKQDEDKEYYLHYLNSFELGVNYSEYEQLSEDLYILIQREIQNQKLKIANNSAQKDAYEKIIKKYEWLKRYLDESQPIHDVMGILFPFV